MQYGRTKQGNAFGVFRARDLEKQVDTRHMHVGKDDAAVRRMIGADIKKRIKRGQYISWNDGAVKLSREYHRRPAGQRYQTSDLVTETVGGRTIKSNRRRHKLPYGM